MDEREQPFLSHLAELRSSLLRALMGVCVCMVLCYALVDHFMAWLKKPMLDLMPAHSSFVVLSPYEYFFVELKAAIFCGVILACPWIFYSFWNFVSPGLYRHEKRFLFLFVVAASLCFVGGIFFAYFLVFPPTFEFFLSTLPEGVHGAYSIGMLFGFAISVLLAFGLVFQTPIAVFLLIVFDLVSYQSLAQYRRHIFVASFVVGALLTPPDPITQVMLAIPTYLLFELGLCCGRVFAPKAKESQSPIT